MSEALFLAAALDPSAPVPEGVVGADGQPTTKRFDVYRNNIVVGLKDALAAGFPAVQALVGAEFFEAMAAVFVRAHPPQKPMMPLYGAEFAHFIAAFPPAARLPYLADVARLEYALREAYHAGDAPALDPAALADPLALTRAVQLAPPVRWLSSPYPVVAIHAAATGGPQPTGGAEDVLITRAAYDPTATAFPVGTHRVLTALAAGLPLAAAFAEAPDTLDINDLVGALISGGALTALVET